ncbi:MAG: large conductance mechanosensitive channel protein MscL [Clostridiales bacterium]|nr:large conductance mechanosensitive channel protein MscL [Clostridiales bacterium]
MNKKELKEIQKREKEKLKAELKKQKEKGKKNVSEFKKFAFKGNIIDLSIGVIIGGAFSKIVTSFTTDIVTPVISLLTNKIDFANLFVSLDGNYYATLEAAKAAGASTINYGQFLQTIIDFFITAIFIFIVIKKMSDMSKKKEEAPAPTTKKCPYCMESISIEATRCPHCTSVLEEK